MVKTSGNALFAQILQVLLAVPESAQVSIEPEKMLRTIPHLAGPGIRGRSPGSPELEPK